MSAGYLQEYIALTDVTETLGLLVAVVVAKVLVVLGSIVPGQLKKTLATGNVALVLALGERLVPRVAQEVEVEAGVRVLKGSEKSHAENILVVREGLLGILDADHCVVLCC